MQCVTDEELNAFALGELPDRDFQRVSDHIDACQRCDELVATLQPIPDELAVAFSSPFGKLDFQQVSGFAHFEERIRDVSLEDSSLAQVAAPYRSTEVIVPRSIGPYLLGDRLGRGGMGEVFKAWHTHLKRHVAIKLIHMTRRDDDATIERFAWEIEAIGTLDAPHVVRALDAGVSEGRHYLVMELVEGIDVARLLDKTGPLSIGDATEVVRQAALGLSSIDRSGLVHRDIKPSNLMLCESGIIKLLDLGLSRRVVNDEANRLTSSHQILGTVDYLSPEQISNPHNVDIRSDLYSLGCTLYELIGGHPPFAGPSFPSMPAKLLAHCTEPHIELREFCPDVPVALSELVDRLLSKDPDGRPESPLEVAENLEPYAAKGGLGRFVRCEELPERRPPARHQPRSKTFPSHTSKQRATVVAIAVVPILIIGAAAWFLPALFATNSAPPDVQRLTANITPNVDGEGFAKPLVWQNNLSSMPVPVYWPGGSLSKWNYDKESQQITFTSNDNGLLKLGTLKTDRYRIQVGLHQNRWSGGLGVFFGLHDTIIDGKEARRFQFIRLNQLQVAPALYTLSRGWCVIPRPGEKGPPPEFTTVGEAIVGQPLGEQLLEIEVFGSRLSEVRLNGVLVKDLTLPEINQKFAPADHQGDFGVQILTSDGIIQHARSMIMTAER